MKLEIPAAEMHKRKIFVATPMYGGACHGQMAKSCIDMKALSFKYGVEVEFFFLFNESLITRARNYCVDEFLRNEKFTHLLFIDSDIGFDPNDAFAMCALAGDESEYDILCAPYPKKTISWEKIKAAVDKGFADQDPQQLRNYVGDYVFNPARNQSVIRLDEPVQVLESGTGFMMIKREALQKFTQAYPEHFYRPDHVRTTHFDGSREIMQFFQAEVDKVDAEKYWMPILEKVTEGSITREEVIDKMNEFQKLKSEKSKRYLSEDYWFCQKSIAAGLKVWLCPWIRTVHIGTYFFGGSLQDLASIGAAATADPTQKIKQS